MNNTRHIFNKRSTLSKIADQVPYRVFLASILLVCSSCTSVPKDPDAAARYKGPVEKDALPSGPSAPDYAASARINMELGAAYLQSGKYGIALEVIEKALAAEPRSATALGIRGLIYAEMKEAAKAEASFKQAIQIDANNPDLNHNYATYLCRSGRENESLIYFSAALNSPGYQRKASTHSAMGKCHMRINQMTEAENQFTLALRSEPTNGAALLGMAELKFRTKQNKQAKLLLSDFRQLYDATAESLWLSLKIERALGNRVEEMGMAADIARLFPHSEPARKLAAQDFS